MYLWCVVRLSVHRCSDICRGTQFKVSERGDRFKTCNCECEKSAFQVTPTPRRLASSATARMAEAGSCRERRCPALQLYDMRPQNDVGKVASRRRVSHRIGGHCEVGGGGLIDGSSIVRCHAQAACPADHRYAVRHGGTSQSSGSIVNRSDGGKNHFRKLLYENLEIWRLAVA
ncbi:unnamed protein product [Soboliphyme baturini]|uniref:CTCK domain-containing protein n=1 Tax=Soboliphyme baturini TaxID=241478 RepID=A0A183IR22_9BILA|nr:unnamed protein product [Soboliphyme baturini]